MSSKGYKHSEESKEKMRNAQLGEKNHNFGKPMSEEQKEKIRKKRIGLKLSKETREKMSLSRIGKHPTEETLVKLSSARKGNKNPMYGIKRDKHPNWNLDKTDEARLIERHYPEYYEWRMEVFRQDNFTCQKCNYKGKHLNAHHIEDYKNNKELRTTVSNGITLCRACHKDFHHQYGNGSTAAFVVEFLE